MVKSIIYNVEKCFLDYIYTNWQKDVVNRFRKLYIYDMAKSVGKMLEIQTHNYRQL